MARLDAAVAIGQIRPQWRARFRAQIGGFCHFTSALTPLHDHEVFRRSTVRTQSHDAARIWLFVLLMKVICDRNPHRWQQAVLNCSLRAIETP